MKQIAYSVALVLGVISLAGCATHTAQTYTPTTLQARQMAQNVPAGIQLKTVTMPKALDVHAIPCRTLSGVTLPKDQTLSSYIQHSFSDVLSRANKLANQQSKTISSLAINLTDVNFSTMSGKWVIMGNVAVGKNSPVSIQSTTNFGGTWYEWNACQKAAENFNVAVSNFIYETFSNVQVKKEFATANQQFMTTLAAALAQKEKAAKLLAQKISAQKARAAALKSAKEMAKKQQAQQQAKLNLSHAEHTHPAHTTSMSTQN